MDDGLTTSSMNKRLRLAVRNAGCTDCGMSNRTDGTKGVCQTGIGRTDATIGVVTQTPIHDTSKMKAMIVDMLGAVGIRARDIMWLSAIKCDVFDAQPTKTEMKACRTYLDKELDFLNLTHVITFGGEALFAATGQAGIMKYRGQLHTHRSGTVVFPTISPAMLGRNPGLTSGFEADIRYFGNLVSGKSVEDDPWHLPYDDQWTVVDSRAALDALVAALWVADAASFDVETTGATEDATDAAIVSLSMTLLTGDQPHVWAIPLYHPESVWQHKWERVLRFIAKAFRRVPVRIAHNSKYDVKWLNFFGMPDLTATFDTIIAAAVLDENRPKGLKPLGQQLLGADPWGIDTKELLTTALSDVLNYNGLDTWHTLRLWLLFREQLRVDERTQQLFSRLMMPAVQELVRVEQRRVYVDRRVLYDNWDVVKAKLAAIEVGLAEHLPPYDDIPEKFKNKKTGEVMVNYGRSLFALWWLFDYRAWPVLARGKQKADGTPGDPSMAESVLSVYASEGEPVAQLLLDRVEWQKFHTSFFTPYADQLDAKSRIGSTFKPWGTVTGRLSSGKEDVEKITGRTARNQLKGVNLQQVPRNKLVRGVFGAAPGWTFVEADYSQIELRIAAFMAREQRMLHLYSTGQDIHMAMAMRMTGKPESQVTKEERKRAKAVNFGFLYGMGVDKFIATAWSNYQLVVTPEESEAFRKSFFDQFPGLLPWHRRQRQLAKQFKRVQTPMGRIRHLPDVDSANRDVQAEAERQAINSPVQAMASDMALLSLVHTARRFRAEGIEAYPICAVHDAVNFEVRDDHVARALPIIKWTMENLPLARLFGFEVDVPIIADLKVGSHWGGATEVPAEIVTGTRAEMRAWLKEYRRAQSHQAA